MIAMLTGLLLSATAPADLTAGIAPPVRPVRTANLSDLAQHQACAAAGLEQARIGPGQFRNLGQLPRAVHQRTVLRSIGGCSVIEAKVDGKIVYVPSAPRIENVLPSGEGFRR